MKYTVYAFLLALLLGLPAGCSSDPKDPEPDPEPGTSSENAKINRWIYQQLDQVYYWYDRLAAESESDQQNLEPEAYFKSILWSKDSESRFSSIESTTRADANGMTYDFGIQFVIWEFSSGYALQVLYVTPGSPAHQQGIRRGDMFCRYNDISINETNYAVALGLSTVTFTYCDEYRQVITGEDGNPKTVQLSKASYYDTPVICDTVYQVNGERIGYLFYAGFESAKGTTDDTDLKNAIAGMREQQIDQLILDLRYNGGGYLQISIDLATLLLPQEFSNDNVYLYQEYTQKTNDRLYTIEFSKDLEDKRLDLKHLHVIVSRYTASASEITIHGLERYMPVTLYGNQTVGKNVGSYAISGESQNIPWILHPISSRLYDNRGRDDDWETFTGFGPDPGDSTYLDELDIDEQGYARSVYRGQLGIYDPQENSAEDCDPLLSLVMSHIFSEENEALSLFTSRATGISAKPVYLPTRPQVLITD